MPKDAAAPQVSIIVPVYNVEEYLSRCLDSILAQTLKEWECICVDDGSTDGSGAILDEYAAKDERFVVIHKENGGTSTARNAGLKVARGEYIGFVDPDDWIESETYEAALEAARRTGADIVQWNPADGKKKKKLFQKRSRKNKIEGFFDIAQNPEYFSSDVWNKLFRRELVFENQIRFPHGVRLGEDRDFSLVASTLSKRSFYLDRGFYHYNNTREASSTRKRTADRFIEASESLKKTCELVLGIAGDGNEPSEVFLALQAEAKAYFLVYLYPPDCRLFREIFPELNGQMLRYFLKRKTVRSLVMLLAAWRLDGAARAVLRIRRALKK